MVNPKKEHVDMNKVSLVDMANQVGNPWNKDTILALVNKSKNLSFSIRLRNMDKSKVKKKFIDQKETESSRKHNRRVINLIFAYLIFKILNLKKDGKEKVYICPDHRPSKEVHRYIQKLSNYFNYPDLTKEIDIDFINRSKLDVPKRTPAHVLAKKVLKGKKKSNMVADFLELDSVISKLL